MLLAALFTLTTNSFAATIAYWTFTDGVDSASINPVSQPNGSTGSVVVVNSTLMRGWDPTGWPSFTSATYGTGLGANFNGAQDGYVTLWFSASNFVDTITGSYTKETHRYFRV